MIWPTKVTAGIEPGWLTLTGWRLLGRSTRSETAQVLVTALPVGLWLKIPDT